MSRTTNPFPDPDWLDIQRSYLRQLTAAGQTGDADGGTGEADWYRAVQAWWQSVLDQTPADDLRALLNNVLHQSLSFSDMSGQFSRLITALSDSGDGEWQNVFHQHINIMKQQFRDDPAAAPAEQWDALLKAWQQTGAAMLPEELFGGINGEGLRDMAERFLALTAVTGPGGEYAAALQEGMRLWQEYRERCRQYYSIFRRLGVAALDCLEQRILELAARDGRISSLRELYNLWVDCNEQVFAEYAASEEYARLYGELLADYMAFRRQGRKLLDTTLQQLDLPGRESLASVSRSQHELQQQLRQSLAQQERTQAALESLQAELDELRRSLKQDASTPRAAARRRNVKKKRGTTGRRRDG